MQYVQRDTAYARYKNSPVADTRIKRQREEHLCKKNKKIRAALAASTKQIAPGHLRTKRRTITHSTISRAKSRVGSARKNDCSLIKIKVGVDKKTLLKHYTLYEYDLQILCRNAIASVKSCAGVYKSTPVRQFVRRANPIRCPV